jgi:hypothetical protein
MCCKMNVDSAVEMAKKSFFYFYFTYSFRGSKFIFIFNSYFYQHYQH